MTIDDDKILISFNSYSPIPPSPSLESIPWMKDENGTKTNMKYKNGGKEKMV